MSSELLGSAQNVLKGNLGGAWDINKGYADAYTDLGIARRFGGSAAAYSLRDIGAMNGRVVKVRRDVDGQGTDPEEDFSASQVDSGALEDWVNGKFENTLPADVDTAAAAYSLRKVRADYAEDAVRIRRSSDDAEVNVAFDSDGKVSTSSSISVVSGTVSGTTLADFISGTDAFVHTWYDQVGSNDITQTTAANQPKIAESGALLADGVDFDGSASYLDATSALGATATVGAFIVHKPDDTDENQYLIDNRDGTGDGMRIMQRSDADGNYRFSMDSTDVNSASGSVTTNETLLTAIQSSTAATLFKNAVQQATAADDAISVTAAFRIGANRVSTGTYFDGTIKEIILFTSDQSDNRFKIESNINNYYGLYNDANETNATEFSFLQQRTEGVTVSNGVSGFTLDVETASAFAGFQLKEKVANTDVIYLSFNAVLTGGSEGDASPKVALRETGISSTVRSNEVNVTAGFNSVELTSNNNDAEYLSFSEGDNNRIFTISDFKVSRIARNGFVETWYDQSANLRDAIQETATNQPSIVQNGGIVKVNSKPAITFDGNDNFLEVDGTGSAVAYSFSPSGDMGLFLVSKQNSGNPIDSRDGAGDGIFLQQGSGGSGPTRMRYNADGNVDTSATKDAQHFTTMILDGTTLSGSVDGGTAVTDTVTAGIDTTGNLHLGSGFNNANYMDGELQEAIFYENNKTSDKSDIEADIDNFYNIT